MNVLIVDDSRATRTMIKVMLRSLGAETLEAENGKEALDQLEAAGQLDLVVVDWNMPVMNGIEFVTAVRAQPEYADLLLMMVTTETEIAQMQRALEAGANEYLMKPFTKEMMAEKLQLLGLGGS